MSRVLLTGGAGTIGAAVVRRLLADPAYDVRVSDRRAAPQWMRESCEIHDGDLRVPAQALAASRGCSHIVHLAACAPGGARSKRHGAAAHTLIEHENALHGAIVRAAFERNVERLVHVSSAAVFERAELFPTPEEHLAQCAAPRSALGFARLAGERYCSAAHDEHGLPYSIVRASGVYGPEPSDGAEPGVEPLVAELAEQAARARSPLELPGTGEQTRTLTHVEDVAEGIVLALGARAALNEDFNLAGPRELTLAELVRLIWAASGEQPPEPAFERAPAGDPGALQRSWPSAEKARELLGWEARVELADGIAALVSATADRAARGAGATAARA
jgi:nucleoside-diphosphate-sugar epimerase